ncbi:Putative aminopeptidase [Echinococcus granulosus]|uniref:Aminopeptidase n=1 Tax=Echinococcus granulosus TaxID=6210 RepID=W6TZL3_ECHGR|nr:Putative aminopeptidase [Echinococcus granulosus]EUB54183.1 Putative aminopeptidase [Echinococcus granulosus]
MLVYLTHKGASPMDTTLFLINKGITCGTGKMDLNAGGAMAGMHLDKSGAAAVAGFFRIFSLLKPQGLSVHGAMALVSNSIGSDSHVTDEIVNSRAGLHVRVGNTDTEECMVMIDLLCEAKEQLCSTVWVLRRNICPIHISTSPASLVTLTFFR